MTGVGWASRMMLEALAEISSEHELSAMILKGRLPTDLQPGNISILEVESDYERHPGGEFWLNFQLPRILKKKKIDLLHGTSFLIPWLPTSSMKVVSIYDMIPFRIPESHPRRFREYIKTVTRLSAKTADRIITPTRHTAEDLKEILKTPDEKISVIPLYPDKAFYPPGKSETESWPEKSTLSKGFFLCVGTLETRKNQGFLIKAFNHFKKETKSGHKLILIGGKGHGSEKIVELVQKSPFSDDIIIHEKANRDDLRKYYGTCTAMVYPTLYEGFGLPLIEAMACGAPVLSAKTTCLPEVGGDAPLYFDMDSPEQLAGKMKKITEDADLSKILKEKSLKRAGNFSAAKTGKGLLECYDSLRKY